jgi:hypothetical protein
MADMNPWIPVLSSLGGVLLGGTASLLGGIVVQWMTLKREREAREHEAIMERERRLAEFQFKTLIELQDSLSTTVEFARVATLKAASFAQKGLSSTEVFESQSLFHTQRSHAQGLLVRIDDATIRELSAAVCNAGDKTLKVGLDYCKTMQYDPPPFYAADEEARGKLGAANEKIGEMIRASDRPK